MTLDDAHNHFGSFAEMSRSLGIASNAYQYWRKIGYIPYRSQLLIQNHTNGKLKATDPIKDMHNVRRED